MIEKCNRPVGTTGVPKGLGGNLVWLTICDVCSGQVGNVIAHERWELNRTRPKDAGKGKSSSLFSRAGLCPHAEAEDAIIHNPRTRQELL